MNISHKIGQKIAEEKQFSKQLNEKIRNYLFTVMYHKNINFYHILFYTHMRETFLMNFKELNSNKRKIN